MTEEKRKRSLRRLNRRIAARRRRRLTVLRLLGRPRLVPVAAEPLAETTNLAVRHAGRLPTRQELQVLAKFRTAVRELGLF